MGRKSGAGVAVGNRTQILLNNNQTQKNQTDIDRWRGLRRVADVGLSERVSAWYDMIIAPSLSEVCCFRCRPWPNNTHTHPRKTDSSGAILDLRRRAAKRPSTEIVKR